MIPLFSDCLNWRVEAQFLRHNVIEIKKTGLLLTSKLKKYNISQQKCSHLIFSVINNKKK